MKTASILLLTLALCLSAHASKMNIYGPAFLFDEPFEGSVDLGNGTNFEDSSISIMKMMPDVRVTFTNMQNTMALIQPVAFSGSYTSLVDKPTITNGTNGLNGATGATGAQGIQGIQGVAGATGATGPAGTTSWTNLTDKPAPEKLVSILSSNPVVNVIYTNAAGYPVTVSKCNQFNYAAVLGSAYQRLMVGPSSTGPFVQIASTGQQTLLLGLAFGREDTVSGTVPTGYCYYYTNVLAGAGNSITAIGTNTITTLTSDY